MTSPAPLPADFLRIPIAHRAYHDKAAGRPENSLEAVRAAVAAGYGVEIDLQPSSDGVPMVFHDYDLKRLTGTGGRIAGRSAAELSALTLLGGSSGIPTLRQVLETVGGRVPLLIEFKDQDGDMGPRVGALEAAALAIIDGYRGPVALMSFNAHSVAALARRAPGLPRGITTSAYAPGDWPLLSAATRDRLRAIPDADAVGASFISHEAGDLGRDRVAALKARGCAILCWTIRSPEAERTARKIAANVTFEGYPAGIPAPAVP